MQQKDYFLSALRRLLNFISTPLRKRQKIAKIKRISSPKFTSFSPFALTSALFSIKYFTMSRWPLEAALCNGVPWKKYPTNSFCRLYVFSFFTIIPTFKINVKLFLLCFLNFNLNCAVTATYLMTMDFFRVSKKL